MTIQTVNTQLSLVKDYCLQKNWEFHEYSKPERLHFLAKNLENPNQLQVVSYGQGHVYLACMHNVTVFGNGFVISEDGENVFVHGLNHGNYPQIIKLAVKDFVVSASGNKLQMQIPKPELTHDDEAVLIWGNTNFGHWLFEYLSKIPTLDFIPRLKQLKLILLADMPKRYLEFLYLMGFQKKQFIFVESGKTIKVSRLWIPSVVHYRGHYADKKVYCSSESLHSLRYKLLQEKSFYTNIGYQKKPLNLYIVRQNTQWRNLINQNEVMQLLEEHGFQSIVMENYSIAEQLELISQAQIVVMPTGGGSPMTMFAAKNAIIIDLSFDGFDGIFGSRLWSHILSQHYYRVNGEKIGLAPERRDKPTSEIDFDFKIPLVELSKILQKIDVALYNISYSQELNPILFPN